MSGDAAWEHAIRALENEAREAFLAGDIATLDRLWDDELHVNSPINRVHDKPTTLNCSSRGASATRRSRPRSRPSPGMAMSSPSWGTTP